MNQERKRVHKDEIVNQPSKKRLDIQVAITLPEVETTKPRKVSDEKYIKIPSDAKKDEFKTIGERVGRGELKWAYCGIDSSKMYQYYLVLKKIT